MKKLILAAALVCSLGVFATPTDYDISQALNYTRESEYYQKQVRSHLQDAEYYRKKAEEYQRQAASYTRRGDASSARDYTRKADRALDDYRVRMKRADDAAEHCCPKKNLTDLNWSNPLLFYSKMSKSNNEG